MAEWPWVIAGFVTAYGGVGGYALVVRWRLARVRREISGAGGDR